MAGVHISQLPLHRMLFPSFADLGNRAAVRVGSNALSYRELDAASRGVGTALHGVRRVAVWCSPSLESIVAMVAGLNAGVPVIPLNPRSGSSELQHVLDNAKPDVVLHAPGADIPPILRARPTVTIDLEKRSSGGDRTALDDAAPALIIYTSGTTGPPKGTVLSRRAIAANLDALADAWAWTGSDVVVHALPLFHVHGLILGTLGPLRRGGTVHHLGTWSAPTLEAAFRSGGTMLFAVPTMYHRLRGDLETMPSLASSLREARLLASGSAPLAAADAAGVKALTGLAVTERYGLTETLINCAVRHDAERTHGCVGTALSGVELRLLDDDGSEIQTNDPDSIGEIVVRGPGLFTEYLDNKDATSRALRDGWFHTADVAWRDEGRRIHLVGRKGVDLIKTGGYKVGAGEVELALEQHPAVAEAAVMAEPDDDLGERIAAWIVLRPGASASAAELSDYVAATLAPHKRPRRVAFVAELPRNEMGKVRKVALRQQRGSN
jgi:malonyl-CoA/methylmalonyl-CoA synthetase